MQKKYKYYKNLTVNHRQNKIKRFLDSFHEHEEVNNMEQYDGKCMNNYIMHSLPWGDVLV